MVHKRKKSTTTENKILWVNNNFFHFLTSVRDIYFNEFLKVPIRFSEEQLIKPTIHTLYRYETTQNKCLGCKSKHILCHFPS